MKLTCAKGEDSRCSYTIGRNTSYSTFAASYAPRCTCGKAGFVRQAGGVAPVVRVCKTTRVQGRTTGVQQNNRCSRPDRHVHWPHDVASSETVATHSCRTCRSASHDHDHSSVLCVWLWLQNIHTLHCNIARQTHPVMWELKTMKARDLRALRMPSAGAVGRGFLKAGPQACMPDPHVNVTSSSAPGQQQQETM